MAKTRNTDPHAFGRGLPPLTNEERTRKEHQRLFGKGATVSGLRGKVIDTPTNLAMNQRPRAANHGKDIRLSSRKTSRR